MKCVNASVKPCISFYVVQNCVNLSVKKIHVHEFNDHEKQCKGTTNTLISLDMTVLNNVNVKQCKNVIFT